MNISLKPDARRFIEEQVKAGRFQSAGEVLEEAVSRMMLDSEDLDDQTAAAINRAEEQIDRGEGMDFDQFAAEIRGRISAK
jgi:putative addiction module CopG family antidote